MKFLIVIDMQNDFTTGTLANEEAVNIIPKISDLIKTFNGKVIFTRDTHELNYLHTNEGRHLPVEHCIKGTYGHQIHRDLLGWRDCDIIDKPTFGSLKLVDKIYADLACAPENIENFKYNAYKDENAEIHLVGTCTDICVVSNAMILKANFPEAKIIVHSSCCAGLDKEGHDAALLVMQRCQIEVVD